MTTPAASVAPDDDSYTMCLRTVQSSTFKNLVDILKEELMDTPIEFDETGMKIVAMDTTRSVLAHVFLPADKFEHYTCKRKVMIGVNMLNFHKIIRTITNDEILTLALNANDPNNLEVERNDGKGRHTTQHFKLIDLGSEKMNLNAMKFKTVTSMPASDFQKICRDMQSLAEFMEIKDVDNQLIFSCSGDFCSQETVICEDRREANDDGGATAAEQERRRNAHDIVQGIFEIKHLVTFAKCSNMCNTVTLMLKNEVPMLVKYDVGSLGEVKFLLAAHVEDEEEEEEEERGAAEDHRGDPPPVGSSDAAAL